MGKIRQEILDHFISKHPKHYDILKPFLSGFDITYADIKDVANATIFAYILKPENIIADAFGIEKEILLAYSPFPELQARAIQAVYLVSQQFPFKNRVDSLNCFIISDDENVLNYSGITSFDDNSAQVLIPFISHDLVLNKNDPWYIRNRLRDYFFDVDLFGYMLPLRDETFFFGRQPIVARYIDAIKRCENRGIFGLRKTGKTSLLFKLDRIIREQHIGFVFFYDCKSPSYRKMHWNEFLGSICENIAKRLNISFRPSYDEINIIKSLRYVMKEASLKNIKIIIMFDEIEYISFKSPQDAHWKNEYIDFWQTLWSIQSLHRNIVFIISGVNPSVTEIDTVNGIQNPLFGIVQSEYLQGLSEDEVRHMIKTLGKRMGLRFTHDSISYLYAQYCGHPLLTRLACSHINRQYNNSTRPINITIDILKQLQKDIDSELTYYFKHVVSEIQDFYPEEYEMFELLSSGQTSDFLELSTIVEFVKHLYSYGLVAEDSDGMPYVKMPVAGRYAAIELAKKENRKTIYKLIDESKRQQWVNQRTSVIIRDLRQLEKLVSLNSLPKLFGENSFPEAEKFAELEAVHNEAEFERFVNVCNRCFVESIENYGKSIGKDKYFWQEIKTSYNALFKSLERIKTYRHSQDHLKLNNQELRKFNQFYAEDTNGISKDQDKLFCIQQKLLETFFTNIQIEMNRLT